MRSLRAFLVAIAGVTGIATAAAAADLPKRVPMKAAPVPVQAIYNWSGFYVGVNFGGSFGNQDVALTNAAGATVASGSVSPSGFIVGDQIGFNWQVNNWVFGIEGDFQGSTQKADGTLAGGGTSVDYTSRLRWFGTVRGRVGWAYDRLLPYVTGGWAFGRGRIDGTASNVVIGCCTITRNFSFDESYSGWTIGAGLEWAFLNRWSAKIEYLYIDFGDGPSGLASALSTVSIAGTNMRDNIVRGGINYRF